MMLRTNHSNVIVLFHSPNCKPSSKMMKHFKRFFHVLSNSQEDHNVRLATVNTDDNVDILELSVDTVNEIRFVPMTVWFNNGSPIRLYQGNEKGEFDFDSLTWWAHNILDDIEQAERKLRSLEEQQNSAEPFSMENTANRRQSSKNKSRKRRHQNYDSDDSDDSDDDDDSNDDSDDALAKTLAKNSSYNSATRSDDDVSDKNPNSDDESEGVLAGIANGPTDDDFEKNDSDDDSDDDERRRFYKEKQRKYEKQYNTKRKRQQHGKKPSETARDREERKTKKQKNEKNNPMDDVANNAYFEKMMFSSDLSSQLQHQDRKRDGILRKKSENNSDRKKFGRRVSSAENDDKQQLQSLRNNNEFATLKECGGGRGSGNRGATISSDGSLAISSFKPKSCACYFTLRAFNNGPVSSSARK